ncbi:MAG: glycosyltransferase family 4 protein [bacterium]
MEIKFFLLSLCTAILSFLGCRYVQQAKLLLNEVESRSSHAVPVSRAGGIVLIGSFLLISICTEIFTGDQLSKSLHLTLLFTCLALLVGVIDDFYQLAAKWKLMAQIILAAGFVAITGGTPEMPLPFIGTVELGISGYFLSFFWIIAFINVFNFMDGLNGLAGLAALTSAIALTILLPQNSPSAWLFVIFAGAVIGFLILNYPMGKVFLGDGGSHAIGFFLASMALNIDSATYSGLGFLFLPIMFLPFILDVFITLIIRARRGEKLYQAHKEHFYQRLHQAGWSHSDVSLVYMLSLMVSAGMALIILSMPEQWQWGGIFLWSLILVVIAKLISVNVLEKQQS